MVDIPVNPSSLVVAGAIVNSGNPIPVSVTGAVAATALTPVAWASIGTATVNKLYRVTDAGAGGSTWVGNGTRWKPLNGMALLASLDTTSASISNAAESLVFQYQMPAALLQLKDRLRLYMTLWKSGTTDTGLVRVRVGTAGTTGDTSIYSATMASAANRQTGVVFDWRVETATTVQQLPGGTGGAGGYSVSAATAGPAASTISNISNSLFFSIGILSGGGNDTVQLAEAQLQLWSTAN